MEVAKSGMSEPEAWGSRTSQGDRSRSQGPRDLQRAPGERVQHEKKEAKAELRQHQVRWAG